MGYAAKTSDPWQLIRQREAERARQLREALRPSGTQVAQVARKVEEGFTDLSAVSVAILALQGRMTTVEGRATDLEGRPQVMPAYDDAANFGLDGGGWVTVATASVTWPAGADAGIIQAHASGLVVGTDPAGLVRARLRIDGESLAVFELVAWNDGSDRMCPVVALGSVSSTSEDDVTVQLQLQADPAAAFEEDPRNEVWLSAVGVFVS
jgi:hypothetical protein